MARQWQGMLNREASDGQGSRAERVRSCNCTSSALPMTGEKGGKGGIEWNLRKEARRAFPSGSGRTRQQVEAVSLHFFRRTRCTAPSLPTEMKLHRDRVAPTTQRPAPLPRPRGRSALLPCPQRHLDSVPFALGRPISGAMTCERKPAKDLQKTCKGDAANPLSALPCSKTHPLLHPFVTCHGRCSHYVTPSTQIFLVPSL
jgi:hypothetical protein